MKKFTVVRSRWCRGGEGGKSKLLNEEGNMCCLGFLAESCGVPKDDLRGVSHPLKLAAELDGELPEEMRPLIRQGAWVHTGLAHDLMETNDMRGEAEETRELKLKKLFAGIGIEVEFV